MRTITISHSHADGTLVTGTSRGDGTQEILHRHQLRWSQHVGWHLRGSRDRNADQALIDSLAAALRAAGHTVEVHVDNTPRPTEEVERDRARRAADRADRLSARAQRRMAAGTALYESGRERLDRIPLGQPVLVDHHSAGPFRRARDRAIGALDRGMELLGEGEQLAARATAVAAHQAHRNDPRVIQRRIEHLEAEARKVNRELVTATAGGHTDWAQRCEEKAARLAEQITYWRGQLDGAIAEDRYRPWGPEHFRKGDDVLVRGHWRRVVRVNRKSLSVETGYSWTDTVPYDRVAGRRHDGEETDRPPRSE